MASGFLAFEDETAARHRTLGFRDLADIHRCHVESRDARADPVSAERPPRTAVGRSLGRCWRPTARPDARRRRRGRRSASGCTHSRFISSAPSLSVVTADFRWRHRRTSIVCSEYEKYSTSRRSCSMPSSLVRVDDPTKTDRPATSTSPPSSVPGAVMWPRSRWRLSISSTPVISARRDWAPGRVMIPISSKTTAVSSTNTESAISGPAASRCTEQPRLAIARSYSACCERALATSIVTRGRCVSSARPSAGLTSARQGDELIKHLPPGSRRSGRPTAEPLWGLHTHSRPTRPALDRRCRTR